MADEGINLDKLKQGASNLVGKVETAWDEFDPEETFEAAKKGASNLAGKAAEAWEDFDAKAKLEAAKQGVQDFLDKTDIDEKAAAGIKSLLDKTDIDDKALSGINSILDKTDLDEKAIEFGKKTMGALSAAVASFKESFASDKDDKTPVEDASEEAPAEKPAQ